MPVELTPEEARQILLLAGLLGGAFTAGQMPSAQEQLAALPDEQVVEQARMVLAQADPQTRGRIAPPQVVARYEQAAQAPPPAPGVAERIGGAVGTVGGGVVGGAVGGAVGGPIGGIVGTAIGSRVAQGAAAEAVGGAAQAVGSTLFPPSAPAPATTRERYVQAARDAAVAAGIDPDIFVRQITQESGFQTHDAQGRVLTSPAGARGIAQIMPESARAAGVDPTDPYASLTYAANRMAASLQRYGGDYRMALAEYNAGAGNLQRYGLEGVLSPDFAKGETRRYVTAILQTARAPLSSQPPATWMPQAPEGGFAGPRDVYAYLTQIYQAADAAKDAYPELDPRRKEIDDAAEARSRNLLTFAAHADQVGYNQANLALGQTRLGLDAYLGQQGINIQQAGLAQRAVEHQDTFGLALATFAWQQARGDREDTRADQRLGIELELLGLKREDSANVRAGLYGYGIGPSGEREPTIAAQQLEQQRLYNQAVLDQARDIALGRVQTPEGGYEPTLAATEAGARRTEAQRMLESTQRNAFLQFLGEGGRSLMTAVRDAEEIRRKAGAWQVQPGQQFMPGFEPGGIASQLFARTGTPFQPIGREQAQTINPNAGVAQFMQYLASIAAAHPGNPQPGVNPFAQLVGGGGY